jgi:hypothetical protein
MVNRFPWNWPSLRYLVIITPDTYDIWSSGSGQHETMRILARLGLVPTGPMTFVTAI